VQNVRPSALQLIKSEKTPRCLSNRRSICWFVHTLQQKSSFSPAVCISKKFSVVLRCDRYDIRGFGGDGVNHFCWFSIKHSSDITANLQCPKLSNGRAVVVKHFAINAEVAGIQWKLVEQPYRKTTTLLLQLPFWRQRKLMWPFVTSTR